MYLPSTVLPTANPKKKVIFFLIALAKSSRENLGPDCISYNHCGQKNEEGISQA